MCRGNRRKAKGNTLVSVTVLIVLIGVVMFTLMTQMHSSRKTEVNVNQQITAQVYAAELLEFFRSFNTGSALISYLSTNPIVPANQPYYFCTLINVLDRANNVLKNAHPIASLPTSSLDAGSQLANRYFLIQVVDANAATFDPAALCPTYETVHFNYRKDDGTTLAAAQQLTAANNLRVVITVGVNWIPKGGTPVDAREVVLSTILPVN